MTDDYAGPGLPDFGPPICHCTTVGHVWEPGESCPPEPAPLRPPEKNRPDTTTSQPTPPLTTSDSNPIPTTTPPDDTTRPTSTHELLWYADATPQARAAFPARADEFAQLWATSSGYIAAMFIRPGFERVAVINQTVMGEGELMIAGLTEIEGVHERFHYPTPVKAAVALMVWAGQGFDGEPDGWVRHKPSFRRRPHGDPWLEYVGENAR